MVCGQIGLLYAVEKKLREKKAGPQLRAAMRVWQSRPVLATAAPGDGVGAATNLAARVCSARPSITRLKRWEALTQFVEDGALEIDNNLIENAIRPSAIGKKNWLFIGHPEAGERSAVIYTLLGSCRRHGINPFDYLKDLFTRLPAAKITQIKEFTPRHGPRQKRRRNDRSGSLTPHSQACLPMCGPEPATISMNLLKRLGVS